MKGTRVLVTGASGFIGRRCLPLLAARGYEVHAVTSRNAAPGTATWHRCDLMDSASCEALVRKLRPSRLLHLAWDARPGAFWDNPANLDWLAAGFGLLRCFYDCGGERAVGIGSGAEYRAGDAACREDSTLVEPATLYGQAKATLGFALRAMAHGRGTWAWARVFSPYGPEEPPGRFMPDVIDALLQGKPVDCTHGRQVRDYVYVDDVASACVALLASDACGAYNVGTGAGHSLREVAEIIARQTGAGGLVRFGAREARHDDSPRVVADVSKMTSELGWSAAVPLAQGIERCIAARAAATTGAR